MFYNLSYYIYILPGLALGLIAQLWISSATSKFSNVRAGSGMSGYEAAKTIRDGEQYPIEIKVEGGPLTDRFDPRNDVVRISRLALEDSVASTAIVAHELGHVDQKFSGSALFKIRSGLVPIVNIGTKLGYFLIIVGLLLNFLGLAQIGILFFALSTIFSLVTLPIEIDASNRAFRLMEKYELLDESNKGGARSVLYAAATSYLAALLTSLLNLLYYVSLVNRRKKA